MKRIVIIHGGGIGDLVQTLPALSAIRRAWPGATITLVGRPERIALAHLAGVADECVDLETCGLWRLGLSGAPVPPALAGADLVIDFLTKDSPAKWQEWSGASGGPARAVSLDPLPPDAWADAASAWISRQVADGLRIAAAPARPEIRVTEADLEVARRTLASHGAGAPFVAIHPGSGSTRKNWPLDRFVAIARRLREAARRQVVWLAGPAELERGTTAAVAGPILSNLTLVETAAVLALADGYVGNDSGISHIAAAVRQPGGRATPTLVLFGPTDPRVWAPSGEHVRVLASPDGSLESIRTEDVWGQVRGMLA
jgi:ADP-heptose:LPS heptosyltransferase